MHLVLVSILILLEISLEVIVFCKSIAPLFCFNPYFVGDKSGRLARDAGKLGISGFQSLFCWR